MLTSRPRSGKSRLIGRSRLLVIATFTAALAAWVILSTGPTAARSGGGGAAGNRRVMEQLMQGATESRQQRQGSAAKRLRIRLNAQQAKGAQGAAVVQLEDDESKQRWQQQQQGRGGEGGAVEQLAAIAEPLGEQEEEREEEQQSDGDEEEEQQQQQQQQQHGSDEGQEEEEEQEEEAEVEDGEEQQESDVSKSWPPGPSPYQRALAGCRDLACLTAAGKQERYPGQFRFPHFFIIGWQKCATTSLYFHLRHHPQMRAAYDKEPEYFTETCNNQPEACPADTQRQYIEKTLRFKEILGGKLRHAGAEASTHYGRSGQLIAGGLYNVFPWLKVIVSMREPISRAISMLAHNFDTRSAGCLAKREVYKCLAIELPKSNYSSPFEAWVEAYPRQQIYLVQYENITSRRTGYQVLHDIKSWLHVDPELPAEATRLARANSRESHLRERGQLEEGKKRADGWPIRRREYEELVALVRPDAQRMAELADRHGFASGAQWLQNWEDEWQKTLDGCDEQGDCIIHPN